MTRDELKKIFNDECTGFDDFGNPIISKSPVDLMNWIADKFCIPGNSDRAVSLFEKAFTGMHDKNQQPIHEGDRVKLYYKGSFVVCQVIYDVKHAAFFIKWPDGYVNQYFMNGSNYEVIGNAQQ